MIKNTKITSVLLVAIFVLSLFAAVPTVSANTDLQIDYIRIDGEQMGPVASGQALEVRRGETLPIRVRVSAINNDVEDVQISAGLYGYQFSQYESSKVFDISNTFDLREGNSRNVDLMLEVPVRMDTENMRLRILVADRDGTAYIHEYQLSVEGINRDSAIRVMDTFLSPSNTVMAGRAVSALVRVQNIGQRTLNDVTLVANIPELGIRDVETLKRLQADEIESFEKIVLRIPSDTPAGTYDVEYTVRFDHFESTTVRDTITVTPCEAVACGVAQPAPEQDDRTMVQVPSSQAVYAGGSEAVFPVMITNTGASARSYTIQVSGVDAWGTARVEPGSNVVVPAGSTSTVFVYVGADAETQAGEKYFKVSIGHGNDMKEVALRANVQEQEIVASESNLQRTLEIALIVLIIILILIGLIVGFNKLRGNNNDEDEAKTYY